MGRFRFKDSIRWAPLGVWEGMKQKKKGDFLTKVVKFGAKSLTLYSLDGNTWSTRSGELKAILDRHEAERQKLLQNMGEAKAQEEKEKGATEEEQEEPERDDAPMIVGEEAEIDLSADDEGDDDEAEEPRAKATSKVAKRTLPVEAAAIAAKAKKSQKKKSKDKVAFVTPKPRQIGKKKVKSGSAKGKKRSAA